MSTKPPSTTADLYACRLRLQQIASILAGRITKEGIAELYTKYPEEFGHRPPTKKPLDPLKVQTWRTILFSDNPPTRKTPAAVAPRLKLILEHFDLVHFDRLDSDEPYDISSWLKRLDEIHDVLLGKRRKNLLFLGSPTEAVKDLRKILRGATTVFNTVFTRSMLGASHHEPASAAVEAVKRELLTTTDCEWCDIVMKNEEQKLRASQNLIEPPETRSRYKISIIKGNLPLLQCLVFKRGDKGGAVLLAGRFSEGRRKGASTFPRTRTTSTSSSSIAASLSDTPNRLKQPVALARERKF